MLVNIGFGNMIAANRLISIVSQDSAPIKRIVQEARERKMLVDATYGRKTKSVLVMDSGHVVLSSLQPDTLGLRFAEKREESFGGDKKQ